MRVEARKLICLGLIQYFVVGMLMAMPAFAQDDQTNQESKSSDQTDVVESDAVSLDELNTKWATLDQKLKAKEQEFLSATTKEERTRISGDFALLSEEADLLIAKIEKAAIKKLETNPSDEPTIKLLMGILINHAAFERRDNVVELGEKLLQSGADLKYFKAAASARRLGQFPRAYVNEVITRAEETKADDLPRVKFETDQGNVVLELFEDDAPNTVANFISLIEKGFYNGLNFHRVIEGFVAQGGCPQGDGKGGPGYNIPCECYVSDPRRHYKYSLSMAHGGRDTGGSQFFITLASTPGLDFRHTVFGRVVEGEEVLSAFARTMDKNNIPIPGVVPTKVIKAEVIRKRDHEYIVKKVGEGSEQKDTPPIQPPIKSSAGEKDDQTTEKSDDKAAGNKSENK